MLTPAHRSPLPVRSRAPDVHAMPPMSSSPPRTRRVQPARLGCRACTVSHRHRAASPAAAVECARSRRPMCSLRATKRVSCAHTASCASIACQSRHLSPPRARRVHNVREQHRSQNPSSHFRLVAREKLASPEHVANAQQSGTRCAPSSTYSASVCARMYLPFARDDCVLRVLTPESAHELSEDRPHVNFRHKRKYEGDVRGSPPASGGPRCPSPRSTMSDSRHADLSRYPTCTNARSFVFERRGAARICVTSSTQRVCATVSLRTAPLTRTRVEATRTASRLPSRRAPRDAVGPLLQRRHRVRRDGIDLPCPAGQEMSRPSEVIASTHP